MSKQQCREATMLGGTCGPVFIPELDELNDLIDSLGSDPTVVKKVLEERLRFISEFGFIKDGHTTKDGYRWPFLLAFGSGSKTVVIAIPGRTDHTQFDGVYLDRSVAVYHQPDATSREIENTVASVCSVLFSRRSASAS